MTDPLAAAVAALTAARTAQMVDACTVTRPAAVGQTPTLDADGNPTASNGADVYAGRCTIADPTSGRSAAPVVTVTDQAGVPHQRVLRVPHDADLHPGDQVTVTASAFSPGLVGDTFLVLGEDERSYATHRRYALRGSSWLSQ